MELSFIEKCNDCDFEKLNEFLNQQNSTQLIAKQKNTIYLINLNRFKKYVLKSNLNEINLIEKTQKLENPLQIQIFENQKIQVFPNSNLKFEFKKNNISEIFNIHPINGLISLKKANFNFFKNKNF